MKNVCLNCNTEYEFEFKVGSFKTKYCCKKCKDEYIKRDSEPQHRTCMNCGEKYWWDGLRDRYEGTFAVDTRKFCSFECGKEYKYKKIKNTTMKNHNGVGFAVKEIRDKINQTKLVKYGDEHFNNREQSVNTCLKKYGTPTPCQSEENKKRIKEAWSKKSKTEIDNVVRKRKNTSKEKYGVDSYSKLDESKNRIKITNLNKYGVENYFQTEECKNKIKTTNLEKYGVECASKSTVVKDKIKSSLSKKTKEDWDNVANKRKSTNLKKYNVEFPQCTDDCKHKALATNLKRYGSKTYLLSDEGQAKLKKANLEKYGVEYAIGSDLVQEKIRSTNLKKYGYEYPFDDPKLRETMEINRRNTNLEKYGTEHIIQVEDFKNKAVETCLERYGVKYNCMTDQCISASRTVVSKRNLKFHDKLSSLGIDCELEFRLPSFYYDVKVDNTLVEINPTCTHFSTDVTLNYFHAKSQNYHQKKTLCALENGYRCIHIWDWDDEDKIVNMLKEKTTLYARNLTLASVSKEDVVLFLNKYHLQNSCNGQDVCLGLYNDTELVEIMTFGKPRYNKKHEWELLRLCSKSDCKVVGGAERLFKYFVKNYNPNSVISYCDNSKFTGDVYLRLGMSLKDYGKPSKHWFNLTTGRHITDNLLRQRGYSQLHNDTVHRKGENNEILMLEAGYLEVYDCGQSVYTWKSK